MMVLKQVVKSALIAALEMDTSSAMLILERARLVWGGRDEGDAGVYLCWGVGW